MRDRYSKESSGRFRAIDCSSWDEFKRQSLLSLREAIDQKEVYGRFVFRGQADSSWRLEPHFDRLHRGLTYKERQDSYQKKMSQFKAQCAAYGRADNFMDELASLERDLDIANEDLRYEAIAQHYGVPTQLLDFSLSMYVAAFFAFSGADLSESGMVSIWALSLEAKDALSEDHLLVHKDAYVGNKRNIWQLGVLVKNRTNVIALEDVFKDESRIRSIDLGSGAPMLFRFDVPASEAAEALDDLNLMRINSISIFPGIHGVVKWMAEGLRS